MKTILKIISVLGLLFTILPSIGVFNNWIDLKLHFVLMIIGMIMWFSTAPFWMKSKSLDQED